MEIYRTVTLPRRDHSNIRDAHQHQRLSTYGGGGRVDGVETIEAQVGRTLPDARQASPVVAVRTLARRWGKRESDTNSRLILRSMGETGRRWGEGQGGREGENQVG